LRRVSLSNPRAPLVAPSWPRRPPSPLRRRRRSPPRRRPLRRRRPRSPRRRRLPPPRRPPPRRRPRSPRRRRPPRPLLPRRLPPRRKRRSPPPRRPLLRSLPRRRSLLFSARPRLVVSPRLRRRLPPPRRRPRSPRRRRLPLPRRLLPRRRRRPRRRPPRRRRPRLRLPPPPHKRRPSIQPIFTMMQCRICSTFTQQMFGVTNLLQRRSRESRFFTGKGQRAGMVGGKPTREGKRDAFLSCVFYYNLLLLRCVRARVSRVSGLRERDGSDRVDTGLLVSFEIFASCVRPMLASDLGSVTTYRGGVSSACATGTLPTTVTIARAIYQRREPFHCS
ncbi:hypothetical protein CI238_02413, partial [Colletotrichum incanum]